MRKKKNEFDRLLAEARKSPEFHREQMIIDFTEDMYKIMDKNGISYDAMAKMLNVPVVHIRQILSGDYKFDFDLIAKIALALGAEVHISMEESNGI